jgi:hypothetical protein
MVRLTALQRRLCLTLQFIAVSQDKEEYSLQPLELMGLKDDKRGD